MKLQRGITLVETLVISFLVLVLLAIGIPKIIEGVMKTKMWEGMTTLNVYESAQLAYFAQNSRIGPIDSLIFTTSLDSSNYFVFRSDGLGRYLATARQPIGRFKKGSWLHTQVTIAGGIPQIIRSCSPGDTAFVRKYVNNFFN